MIIEERYYTRREYMLRVIGCVLVIMACSSMGFEKSKELSVHRKQLEELQRIFTLIQTKIEYIKIPFDELFVNMDSEWLNAISKELKQHKKSFKEIWISSIETHFKESFLTKSELEELKQIGKNISHPEAIRLYLIQLDNAIQTTREEEKEKKKLYQSMGIMAGIFLVIMLI